MHRYLRLVRPVAWICFLLPFAAGFFLGSSGIPSLNRVILSYISFSSWMAFSFTVNALHDRDVDKLHDGRVKDLNLSLQPIATGEVSEREAKLLSAVFLCVSFSTAAFVGVEFLITMLAANFVGYIYSAPPRFKAWPVMDVVCNALAGVLAFHAGICAGGGEVLPAMYVAAFFLAATFYIPTAVSDYEFDRRAGIRNTPVFFGPERVLKFLYVLAAITVVLWCYVFVLSKKFEIRLFSSLIAIYTIVYTHIVNAGWDGEKLNVTPNLIFIPFGTASLLLTLLSFG